MLLLLFSNIIIVETNSYAKEIVANCFMIHGLIEIRSNNERKYIYAHIKYDLLLMLQNTDNL